MKKEVTPMDKNQLFERALEFVTIPPNYALKIKDYTHNRAIFMWGDEQFNEGIEVVLDSNGQLRELTKPPYVAREEKSQDELRAAAEAFLTSQYPKALQYITFTSAKKDKGSTIFQYDQLVGGYPLKHQNTRITVACDCEISAFSYGGYLEDAPPFPTELADPYDIFAQLKKAPWKLTLQYLHEREQIEAKGLYPIYSCESLNKKYDAVTGVQIVDEDEVELEEVIVPFPNVTPMEKLDTFEKMFGIAPDMVRERVEQYDDDHVAIIWRKLGYKTCDDHSLSSFYEQSVGKSIKAKVETKTGVVKTMMAFINRHGDLNLPHEACRDIATSFITTYYADYIPFLKMAVEEATFNDMIIAHFTFPLFMGDDLPIEGEYFRIGVNKTTGNIDQILTPIVPLAMLQSFEIESIQPLNKETALAHVTAELQWIKQYKGDDARDVLVYKLQNIAPDVNKHFFIGIDARNGNAIYSSF